MANDLTNLIPHVEEMRARLSQTANTERSLVQELSDALKRFDQDTLQNVRNLTSEHEARRAAIFNELQALACSIGVLQPPHDAVAAPQQNVPQQIDYGRQYAPGDWHQATNNMQAELADIQDELEFHLNGKGPRH